MIRGLEKLNYLVDFSSEFGSHLVTTKLHFIPHNRKDLTVIRISITNNYGVNFYKELISYKEHAKILFDTVNFYEYGQIPNQITVHWLEEHGYIKGETNGTNEKN